MSIEYEVLGQPGRDNALLVQVDSGRSLDRLLFDLEEGCLGKVAVSTVQSISAVFFSHCHVDHVAGFDSFMRMNWYREDAPVCLYGPRGVTDIVHHRLQGVTWNLVKGLPGEWHVHEIDAGRMRTMCFRTGEGFAVAHRLGEQAVPGPIRETSAFVVDVCEMNHGVPSLAYAVREREKQNVDMQSVAARGWKPGPWLQRVKAGDSNPDDRVELDGQGYTVGELRAAVLKETPGESIAYLTDFLPDEDSEDRLVEMIRGCSTIVCENNYRTADVELAKKNFHMTSADVARLASRAEPDEVVLFHLSDRYSESEWREQLAEVRERFENTIFPPGWELG